MTATNPPRSGAPLSDGWVAVPREPDDVFLRWLANGDRRVHDIAKARAFWTNILACVAPVPADGSEAIHLGGSEASAGTPPNPAAQVTDGELVEQVAPKDFRTPEARKWADEFIPPLTCGSIDEIQNALENLRDANSQLRHAAHLWRHAANDETIRRRRLGESLARHRERFAEIRRIARIHDAPTNILAAMDEVARDALTTDQEGRADG